MLYVQNRLAYSPIFSLPRTITLCVAQKIQNLILRFLRNHTPSSYLNPSRVIYFGKYQLIQQFLKADVEICWDHVEKKGFPVQLVHKVYIFGHNLFSLLSAKQPRYETKKEFLFLKMLESIDLEISFREQEFLALSFFLKQKMQNLFSTTADLRIQILTQQIIQKIDSVHRSFEALPRKNSKSSYTLIFPHLL